MTGDKKLNEKLDEKLDEEWDEIYKEYDQYVLDMYKHCEENPYENYDDFIDNF